MTLSILVPLPGNLVARAANPKDSRECWSD